MYSGLLRTSSIFAAAYWTVLVAELIGDKSIYTVATLTSRFRLPLVLLGISFAFGAKMLAAVLLGNALVQVPARWTTPVSAGAFFIVAIVVWRRKQTASVKRAGETPWPAAAATSFASLFFTEWGDPGQISAAALAATSHEPVIVWCAGTMALITKGVCGATLGIKLKDRIPEKTMRLVAVGSCLCLGLISLFEAIAG